MPVQDLIPLAKAIMYDGTNSAEIIAYFGSDPTVSEVDGVWEVNDGMHDPMTVVVGDWFTFGNYYFQAAAEITNNYYLPGGLVHP